MSMVGEEPGAGALTAAARIRMQEEAQIFERQCYSYVQGLGHA